MDPQKLLFIDKRVIFTIRSVGLIISSLLALVCGFVFSDVLKVKDAYQNACIPLAIAFMALGILQSLWNPYTKRKVAFYVDAYLVLGALLSIFVTGFTTLIFQGWTILITVMVLYFSWQRAVAGYMIMLASLLTWIGIHFNHHNRGEIFLLYFAAFTVGLLVLLIANIWRITNSSVMKMEKMHDKQNFEHSQLTSLINSMADGVIAVDTTAKVVLYNAAALNVLDLNSSMQGKTLKKFIELVDKTQQPVDIVKLVTGTKLSNVSRDYQIKYSDGSFANLYLSIAPVHLGYGQKGSHGFVLLMRDITHEKSLEEERDEFISVVSHELRTPIAISEGNISNAQLIAEKTGDMDKVKSSLQEAHNQVLFLADMINDLATLSRAERGKLVPEIEQIDISALVTELASNYTTDAQAKGLELKATIDPEVHNLSSSKLYVREVLQNFITNAIKYTESGSVTILAHAGDKSVIFEVKDTGIGISKGDQERVFDKFFRSEDYRTRQNSGTGLGLYVTMKLSRLIHADISLTSELNKGSTFTITIPNIEAEAAKPKEK
jgi:PAS domain S-box-containing protein